MIRLALAFSILAVTAPAGAQTSHTSLPSTPAALQIFERDWVLMNWALKYYDSDRDIMLAPSEAQAATDSFRKLADTDGDGRVTPQEYRAARAFILARY
jgi:hypothetical protein